MLKTDMYVRLKDVLALTPNDDVCGPKPSYLRQMIADLPTYLFTKEENEK